MERYGMLDHIRDHSIMVEKIANVLALELREMGVDLSIPLIEAGALMHDIGKTLCLNSTDDHAAKGKEICLQNNLEEIAEIVDEHITLKAYQRDSLISEKEIVYYADKRVNHDRVVSLEERQDYIIERYARGRNELCALIIKNFDLCREVEKKIFSKLNFSPENLAEMIP